MPASYPTSAKTFTTRATNDVIEAAHMNDVQDEIAALESALLTAFQHDLKFTDNTYDIGKSGATRPRDVFLSRDLTIGRYVIGSGQPRALAYHTADQAISTGTWTSVAFGAEDFDVGTMHDNSTNNSRLTVPSDSAGLYLFVARALFAANSTGSRSIRLRINGSTTRAQVQIVNAGASDGVAVNTSMLYVAAVSDYVEAQVWQNSGGNLNVLGSGSDNAHRPEFFAVRLW